MTREQFDSGTAKQKPRWPMYHQQQHVQPEHAHTGPDAGATQPLAQLL